MLFGQFAPQRLRKLIHMSLFYASCQSSYDYELDDVIDSEVFDNESSFTKRS